MRVLPEEAYNRTQDIIVIGAHFDTTNTRHKNNVEDMIAPGADDNASGVAVLVETAVALSRLMAEKRVLNEVQFHFWAAEEIGLIGSSSVFETMRNDSRSVKAVLNMDMVGYNAGHEAGSPVIALEGSYTNTNLTIFTIDVIQKYSAAKIGIQKCHHMCSDHASAWNYGFPSAALRESAFLSNETGNQYVHTELDTMDHLDFDYMVEFVKVAVGFVAELAYTNFTALE